MKSTLINCDRCGREIKEGEPDSAEFVSKKREIHLCPKCHGHFLTDFLTAHAARMGIKPNIEVSREVGH